MMDTSLSNIRCPSGPYRDVSIRHKYRYGLPASIAACRHNTRREKATSQKPMGESSQEGSTKTLGLQSARNNKGGERGRRACIGPM